MKKMIKASSDFNSYEVTIQFGGMIGSEATYDVLAKDPLEAEQLVVDLAEEDLSVEDLNQIDDTEWEVEVGFQGQVGVSEYYTVYDVDNEQEAYEEGIQAAIFDIEIIEVREV